jgi:hypothetical protein
MGRRLPTPGILKQWVWFVTNLNIRSESRSQRFVTCDARRSRFAPLSFATTRQQVTHQRAPESLVCTLVTAIEQVRRPEMVTALTTTRAGNADCRWRQPGTPSTRPLDVARQLGAVLPEHHRKVSLSGTPIQSCEHDLDGPLEGRTPAASSGWNGPLEAERCRHKEAPDPVEQGEHTVLSIMSDMRPRLMGTNQRARPIDVSVSRSRWFSGLPCKANFLNDWAVIR